MNPTDSYESPTVEDVACDADLLQTASMVTTGN